MTNYVPQGFSTVTPFLMVENANKLLEFMKQALDAKEQYALRHDDGTLWHAQMKVGDAMIMVGDTMKQGPVMPAAIYLYVPDADAAYKKAIEAGAEKVSEPDDQFYGDRVGGVKDAFGNMWWFSTHIENLAPAEMTKRAKEFEAQVRASGKV